RTSVNRGTIQMPSRGLYRTGGPASSSRYAGYGFEITASANGLNRVTGSLAPLRRFTRATTVSCTTPPRLSTPTLTRLAVKFPVWVVATRRHPPPPATPPCAGVLRTIRREPAKRRRFLKMFGPPQLTARRCHGNELRGRRSREDDAQPFPAPHRRGGRQLRRVVVDVPLRPPVEQFVERDAALQPGQVGAQTEVQPLAEGEMRAALTVDVEGVRVVVAARIPVGGPEQQEHRAAGRHRGAVALEVARHPPGDVRAGRLEPQRLLDDPAEQRPVLVDVAPLVGVFGQDLGQPADQPAGGLVAGAGHHLGVVEHLPAGEFADHS